MYHLTNVTWSRTMNQTWIFSKQRSSTWHILAIWCICMYILPYPTYIYIYIRICICIDMSSNKAFQDLKPTCEFLGSPMERWHRPSYRMSWVALFIPTKNSTRNQHLPTILASKPGICHIDRSSLWRHPSPMATGILFPGLFGAIYVASSHANGTQQEGGCVYISSNVHLSSSFFLIRSSIDSKMSLKSTSCFQNHSSIQMRALWIVLHFD